MKNFQHFLVTRINVDWNISKPRSQEERNCTDFLSYRFDLFEKICYPSVNAQINQNFIWLILCDSNLPDEFRERLASYNSKIEIIPIYIENKENCLSTLTNTITDNILEQTTHIITTNVDSDDAISENFISKLQKQFQCQDFEFINFPFGYLYTLNKHNLFLREWLTSPFPTLIEKCEKFETVMKYPHADIPEDKTRQIITEPVWLMTAHDKNVRTRYDTAAAWQPSYRLGNNFCTQINFPQKSSIALFKEFVTAINYIISSERKWDTPKVKLRKILNILFPSLVRFSRKLRYR